MVVTFFGMVIVVSPDGENTELPKVVKDDSIPKVTELKLVHEENAELPILVTESATVTELKLVHELNAPLPIFVTESGTAKELSFVHELNALVSIVVSSLALVKVTDSSS